MGVILNILRVQNNKPPGQRNCLRRGAAQGCLKRQTLFAKGIMQKAKSASCVKGKKPYAAKRKQGMVRDNKEEMTMKKQIFGAILLSAALAVGSAMPAFAATVTDTTSSSGTVGSNSSATIQAVAGSAGETTVNINTVITQINVTVPLTVGFVAETGGGTLGVPSDGTYKIKNGSAAAIYITQVDLSAVDASKWKVAELDGFDATSTAAANVVYGNIAVKMTPVVTGSVDPIQFSGTAKVFKFSDGQLKIAKKDVTVGAGDGELAFNFEGKNGILNTHNATATELTKIAYTVALNPAYKPTV